MSSVELIRNVLFPKKVVKNRHLERRCLSGRRSFSHESEGTFPPGHDDQGEGEGDDHKGGIRGPEDMLPTGSPHIQAIPGGRG
jgi:hypothetical protein